MHLLSFGRESFPSFPALFGLINQQSYKKKLILPAFASKIALEALVKNSKKACLQREVPDRHADSFSKSTYTLK